MTALKNPLLAFVLLFLWVVQAGAASVPNTPHTPNTVVPYAQGTFDALQQQGKPVLVWTHADWCSVCRTQGKVLDALLPRPELQGLSVLKVDFDEQKSVMRSLRANRQSTFILFRGGKEIARSLGETQQAAVLGFLKQAL